MSKVCWSRSAWWACLVLGVSLHQDSLQGTFAVESNGSPTPGIVFETYVKPDGPAYFAIKLSPQLAQPKTQPHDVVVLFDTSASQVGAYRTKALGVLRAMLAGLAADDRVMLLAVDVTAARLTPTFVPPNGDALRQALSALERRVPLGSTDMREALEAALATWPGPNDARSARSVVYLGDGLSTAGPVPVEALARIVGQCADRRVACTSYAIGPVVEGGLLGALANQTGGMLIADDVRAADRQVGSLLAAMARAAVIWPTGTKWPAAFKDIFPRRMPPLRFDRDSLLLGTLDPKAAEAGQPLSLNVAAELAGKPVTLTWQAVPERPLAENAYLGQVVELAALTGGVALPTVGSAGLNELRRLVTFGAQQLARLGEQALAMGRTDEAEQLAHEAERLDPANAEANLLHAATARRGASAADDLRMARDTASAAPPAAENGAADGALLDNLERQRGIVEGFLQAEVKDTLSQASATMSNDPELSCNQLKLLLEKVSQSAELRPEVRSQMMERIEGGLRAASRMSNDKIERDLQRQQADAAGESRERANRQLFVQEQKIDQLMSRFEALMDEERYRDAEALAVIAEDVEPGTSGLRVAELSARTVGYTASINAARDMRYKGFTDNLLQVELSHVPFPDDPPIVYPGPEVWQLITERRKKFKAVDLKENGPSEVKILAALDDKTELDFAEQPLSDVIDYLKNRHNIEIQLDKKALADAGVGSEVPVTRTIKGITLKSALKLLLGEFDLSYVLRDEVLMITSKTEAEQMLSNRVYPVADLVVPIAPPRNMSWPGGGGMGGGLLGMPGGGSYGMGMGGGRGGMGGGMGGMGGMGMGGMGMGGMGMGGGMGFF